MSTSKLSAALDAAARGFRVFPVLANSKIPAIDNWPDKATSDPTVVDQWWRSNPDYNIGIATGHGVFVIDADRKNGKPGMASLDMLDMLGLPESIRVVTPSDGAHVYLRSKREFGNRADTIADYPGIDIRGERGYVLAPGSSIDGIPYTHVGGDILADAPEWLEDIVGRHTTKAVPSIDAALVDLDLPDNIANAIEWLAHHAPEAIESQGGDTTTYSVAAELRARGVSKTTALELLAEHWNEQKASPPWQLDDLEVKVENAFTHGQGAPGYKTAAGEFGIVDIEVGEPPARGGGDAGIPSSKNDAGLNLIRASDFAPLEKPVRRFVDGANLIPERNVTIINGDGATGKSLLSMQLCVACSGGGRWIGLPVEHGPTLYLSAEDDADETHIRLKEICAGERINLETLNNLHLAVMAGEDCLLAVESDKAGAVLRATKLYQKLRAEIERIRPIVVVLDNLADIYGANENVKGLVRQFVGMLRAIAIDFNCAVVLLAHPSLTGMSSGSGSSGNVAWNNSVRSRLYLQRDKDDDGCETDPDRRILESKKANYTRIGDEIEMRWENGRFVALAPLFDDLEEQDGDQVETKQAKAERVFLEMVERFNRENRFTSPSKGANYAPSLFAKHHRHGGVSERLSLIHI